MGERVLFLMLQLPGFNKLKTFFVDIRAVARVRLAGPQSTTFKEVLPLGAGPEAAQTLKVAVSINVACPASHWLQSCPCQSFLIPAELELESRNTSMNLPLNWLPSQLY